MRLAALFVIAAIAGCQDRTATQPATPAATTHSQPADLIPPPKPPEPATDIGNAMVQEFRDNVISAKSKWIGKRVRMRNTVTSVGEDRNGFYLTFYSGAKLYPTASDLDAFGKTKRGDQLITEGVIQAYHGEGLDLQIVLSDGKFVERTGRVELGP